MNVLTMARAFGERCGRSAGTGADTGRERSGSHFWPPAERGKSSWEVAARQAGKFKWKFKMDRDRMNHAERDARCDCEPLAWNLLPRFIRLRFRTHRARHRGLSGASGSNDRTHIARLTLSIPRWRRPDRTVLQAEPHPGAEPESLFTHFAFNSALVIVFWISLQVHEKFHTCQFNTLWPAPPRPLSPAVLSASRTRTNASASCCASRRIPLGLCYRPYQIEGAVHEDGRKPSVWDTFPTPPAKLFREKPADVADNSTTSQRDVQLLKKPGRTGYRLFHFRGPVSFRRNRPAERKGIALPAVVDELLKNNIAPNHTLPLDLPQLSPADAIPVTLPKAFADLRRIHFPPALDRVIIFSHRRVRLLQPTSATKAAKFAPGLK